jgi:poly(hydroxyalkanoate) depolymerase family esterase
MFDHLGPAMRRALAAARAADPGEATRVIQEALGGMKRSAAEATPLPLPAPATIRRRGMGETFSAMRSGATIEELRPARQPATPAGATFLKRNITTTSGSRDYHLFVPSARSPKGLVVMLHGCKQHAEDFAAGTTMNAVAEAESMLVAYPTQTRGANPSQCWNWFRPEDQQRGRGEPHIIAEMTRAIMTEHGIRDCVFVAGLSAGGAMAAVMGATYADLYDAVGIHSGLPYRAAHDVSSALGAMRGDIRASRHVATQQRVPRQIVFHGSRDNTVVPANARTLKDAARKAHDAAETVERRFTAGSRRVEHTAIIGRDGIPMAETWMIEGAGHHWIGGDPAGSYAKAEGPNASREMMRFFLGRPLLDYE